jgi:hypothetical protein
MLKFYLFIIAMAAVVLASWKIQEFHVGLGYGIGVIATLIGFFTIVNEYTKESR